MIIPVNGGEEILSLYHGLNVGPGLGELLSVILENVPVSLQCVVDCRRLRLLGGVICHSLVHLGQSAWREGEKEILTYTFDQVQD